MRIRVWDKGYGGVHRGGSWYYGDLSTATDDWLDTATEDGLFSLRAASNYPARACDTDDDLGLRLVRSINKRRETC